METPRCFICFVWGCALYFAQSQLFASGGLSATAGMHDPFDQTRAPHVVLSPTKVVDDEWLSHRPS